MIHASFTWVPNDTQITEAGNHVKPSNTCLIPFHGTKRKSIVNPYLHCGLASALKITFGDSTLISDLTLDLTWSHHTIIVNWPSMGITTSPRLHYFRECSLAQALVQVLTDVSGTPVLRHQLWLAIPSTTVLGKVWDVVCLAAISALREGWVFLCTHQSPPDLHLGKVMVIATFWSRLNCFAFLHKSLFENWRDFPPHHPFLV
jgi:hypothetical protein